jgi:hypothetical protein
MLTIDYDNKCIAGDIDDIFTNIKAFKYFKCKYDVENKRWLLPSDHYDIQNYNRVVEYVKVWNADVEKRNEEKKQLWQEALHNLNLKYVKKGSDDYKLVLEEYKKLLNNNKMA